MLTLNAHIKFVNLTEERTLSQMSLYDMCHIIEVTFYILSTYQFLQTNLFDVVSCAVITGFNHVSFCVYVIITEVGLDQLLRVISSSVSQYILIMFHFVYM